MQSHWDKTSLKESFTHFQESFLKPMMAANKKRIEEKEKEKATSMDF